MYTTFLSFFLFVVNSLEREKEIEKAKLRRNWKNKQDTESRSRISLKFVAKKFIHVIIVLDISKDMTVEAKLVVGTEVLD